MSWITRAFFPFRRVYDFIFGWFRPRLGAVGAPAKRRTKAKPLETGVFYFREQILDQLDDYFVCLRRMKYSDPDAYALYSKVGANIIAKDALVNVTNDLSAWWRAGHRPGFGAVAFGVGIERDDETIHAKFVYFKKFERAPFYVQPSNGAIYSITGYWDDPEDKKMGKCGVCQTWFVSVDANSNMTMLRTLSPRKIRFWSRDKKEWVVFYRNEWKFQDVGEDKPRDNPMKIFSFAAQYFENTSAGGIRVSVTKNDVEAVFFIDMKRSAYFFADRDGPRGRKKIFHIVRAHKRSLRSGKDIFVKFHFRGERSFDWNGYQVHVTVPGLHHMDLTELEIASLDQDDVPANMDVIDTSRAAGKIQRVLHS